MTHAAPPQPQHTPTEAVSPLELLFDLVFAFGVSGLSHHLLMHLGGHGFAETLLLAIFSAWAYTSWSATIISVSRQTTQGKVLLSMLVILFMNAGIGEAFGAHPWNFVLPFLLVQLGGTLWSWRSSADPLFREHFVRTFVWQAAAALLWLAGALHSDERLEWWLAAALLDLLGTVLAHPLPRRRLTSQDVPFDWEHMLERGRLLFLIALGETVLTAGDALTEVPRTFTALVSGAAALSVTTALWAMTFGRTNGLAERHMEQAHDPIRSSLLSVNSLPGLMLGLVLFAVGAELAIVHPYGHASAGLSGLLFGGPLLVIGTQSGYGWAVTGHAPRLRLLACLSLLVAGVLTLSAPPLVSLVLAAAIAGVFAVLDMQAKP